MEMYLFYFGAFRRLRVVSNFGDCDCGAGKIHTRARESSRRRDAKGAPKSSLLEISLARVCILPAPQSPSPKLETTRSLAFRGNGGKGVWLQELYIRLNVSLNYSKSQ